ncbi:MAG: hypothetical protein ACXWUB_13275, partial [Burkholderiales bacterium]
YDALVTAASGPAPRLDRYDGMDFWTKPSIYNLFNVSAGPALSVCIGFGESGLPIGMQIGAAPFRDDIVLRIGHAYERATTWRARHPKVEEGPAPKPIQPAAIGAPDVDLSLRTLVDRVALHTKISTAREHAMLLQVAPYAVAMAQRIPRDYRRTEEPAFQFRFPRCARGATKDGR